MISTGRALFYSQTFLCAAVLAWFGGPATLAARDDDFAIRDGDTVVFLGDSITAARTYGKIIENYTLLRFPDRRVRFFNAGWGGDTAAGGRKRLDRDVFDRGATLLTVAYGTNDIGWGAYADAEHKAQYLEAIRGIVAECKKRGVRVYICSAAITAADPTKSEDRFLQKMCDEGMQISRAAGGDAIDVQREMRVIQQRVWAANEKVSDGAKKTTMHAADGVHLNELGQLAMAYAILKGLGAPSDVSSAEIDAEGPKRLHAANCTVSNVVWAGGRLEFTRLDRGLPFNYGLFYALNYRFVPVHHELNRYLLKVVNLPEGRHTLNVDGRKVSTYTARQLAAGVNVSSATADAWQPGGPWDAQANILRALTDSRHELASAGLLTRAYLGTDRLVTTLAQEAEEADLRIMQMQREIARPRPYRYVLEPAAPEARD
jgi:lysophospholipase L1-like esterase